MIGTIKISQLPFTNTLDGNENIIINQSLNTRLTQLKSVIGLVTYSPSSGIATVAEGLTGTPNLDVGVVTATSYYGNGINLSGVVTSLVGYATETYVNNLVGFSTVGLASEGYVDNLVAISTFSGDYNDLINQPSIPSIVGLASEGYVDDKVGLSTVGLASTVSSLPTGGTTGQVLSKVSDDDYDADWTTLVIRTTSVNGLQPALSFAPITYGATVDLDLAALDGQYRTITLTGNITFTTSNRAAGRTVVIRLLPGASERTLTFPADWVFVSVIPTTIAANKTAILSLTFFGTNNSDCIATYSVQL